MGFSQRSLLDSWSPHGNRTTILHLHPCIFHYATRKPCEFGLFRSYIRTSSIFAGPGSGAQRTLLHGTATHASIASLRVITWGRMRCLAVLTCHTMLPSPVGPAGSRAARAARAERSCHWRSEKFGVSGFSYVDVTFDLNLRTEPVVIFNCGPTFCVVKTQACSKLTKTTAI